jgi:hypothetical protein
MKSDCVDPKRSTGGGGAEIGSLEDEASSRDSDTVIARDWRCRDIVFVLRRAVLELFFHIRHSSSFMR